MRGIDVRRIDEATRVAIVAALAMVALVMIATVGMTQDLTPGGRAHGTTMAAVRQAGEDTRDGDTLTPAMVEALAELSPDTDPSMCRAHIGDTTWITCDNGTEIKVS